MDQTESGRANDQGYLEDWPKRFPGVVESKHIGVGVAPWNADRYPLQEIDGKMYVKSEPLIFYHFSGLRMSGPNHATHILPYYGVRMTPTLKNLYLRYLRELRAIMDDFGIQPVPLLDVPKTRTLKDRLLDAVYWEVWQARFILAGPFTLHFDYGRLGPRLIGVYRVLRKVRRMFRQRRTD